MATARLRIEFSLLTSSSLFISCSTWHTQQGLDSTVSMPLGLQKTACRALIQGSLFTALHI